MKWPNYIRFLPVIAILLLVQCKSQEQAAEREQLPSVADTPCAELYQNMPEGELAFYSEATSDSEDIASRKAKKQSVIDLLQFFQSEFINGSQKEIFGKDLQLGGWEEFRKQWAETNFEMMGSLHNRNAFSHHQNVMQDSAGDFRVVNMLTVSKDWIRNHWEKTLKETDPAVYNTAIREEVNPIEESEIQKEHPCE